MTEDHMKLSSQGDNGVELTGVVCSNDCVSYTLTLLIGSLIHSGFYDLILIHSHNIYHSRTLMCLHKEMTNKHRTRQVTQTDQSFLLDSVWFLPSQRQNTALKPLGRAHCCPGYRPIAQLLLSGLTRCNKSYKIVKQPHSPEHKLYTGTHSTWIKLYRHKQLLVGVHKTIYAIPAKVSQHQQIVSGRERYPIRDQIHYSLPLYRDIFIHASHCCHQLFYREFYDARITRSTHSN